MTIEEKSGKKRCSQEIGSPVTKATCCCSVGRAWGGRCELCPAAGSEEFKHLCPGGVGYRPNVTTVTIQCRNYDGRSKSRVTLAIVAKRSLPLEEIWNSHSF